MGQRPRPTPLERGRCLPSSSEEHVRSAEASCSGTAGADAARVPAGQHGRCCDHLDRVGCRSDRLDGAAVLAERRLSPGGPLSGARDRRRGWQLSLVVGSVGGPGDLGYAPEFFSPLPVTVVDYTDAMNIWRSVGDPLRAEVPLHPSFEDRPGAPDRIFASLDEADFERQVSAWSHVLQRAGLAEAGLAHLHHLTPVNEAVNRLRLNLPVVVSLNGAELRMLESIEGGGPDAARPGWAHAAAWAERLRGWTHHADRLIVNSPTDAARAVAVLGVTDHRVLVDPPGVDQERFRPVRRTPPSV